jgi:hypothetical protein
LTLVRLSRAAALDPGQQQIVFYESTLNRWFTRPLSRVNVRVFPEVTGSAPEQDHLVGSAARNRVAMLPARHQHLDAEPDDRLPLSWHRSWLSDGLR